MIINRPKYLDKLIKQKDKDLVKIITGMRRCGKSVLLFDIYYNYLLSIGVNSSNIIKVQLDLKRNENYRGSNNLYEYVSSLITNDDKHYIFLDEIQLVDSFEDVVNGLKAEFNSDIYITGSNSKLLSSDINTKFRGRGIEIRVYPLSFEEYFTHYNTDKSALFNQYVLYGGLPYLLQEPDENEKINYLSMICNTVVTRDVIERFNIQNVTIFNSVIDLLCSSIGSYVSSSKIANTLKSNGHKLVDDSTISKYLDSLCDAFLFYKVQRFDIKGKGYLKTLHKYYITDLGLRNIRLNFRQMEMSRTIENIVYMELIKRGYLVDIGKNDVQEIDFIARSAKDLFYIQVSYTIENQETLLREINAFKSINDGYKKIIITMDNSPYTIIENGYRRINIIDFLLDDDALIKI